jgi:hypothetical protein
VLTVGDVCLWRKSSLFHLRQDKRSPSLHFFITFHFCDRLFSLIVSPNSALGILKCIKRKNVVVFGTGPLIAQFLCVYWNHKLTRVSVFKNPEAILGNSVKWNARFKYLIPKFGECGAFYIHKKLTMCPADTLII